MKPVLVILLICLSQLTLAQVPGTLSYQGILMQSDGITPISDGAHSIVFNFYTVSSGGSALFSRTISVTTTKGLYSCIIGSGTTPNAPFTTTEMNQIGSQQVFIAITVDGGSELSPRAQLTPGAYSFRAESVTQTTNPTGGNISFWGVSNTLSSDAKLFWDNNNKWLGLGTSTPAGPLDIRGSVGNFRAFDYVLQFTRPSTNYFHATSAGGQFYFTVNGNTDTNASMMIKANGNVGINTTNPLEKLHVNGNIFTSGSFSSASVSTGPLSSGAIATSNHFITGTSSPTSAEGAPGSEAAITIQRGATGGVKNGNTAEIKVSTWESGINGRTSMEFWLSGLPNNENGFGSYGEVPVLVLHGDDLSGTSNQGRVGIGTLSPSTTLSVNGDANKVGGGTWGVFSDIRLKREITNFTDGLDVLSKIQPVHFQYNGLGGFSETGKNEIGIIAQDVQKVAPYMVTSIKQKLRKEDTEETDILMYDGGSSLIYVLVNSVKEQQTEIEELKTKNKNLEQRLQEIETLLSKNSVSGSAIITKSDKP